MAVKIPAVAIVGRTNVGKSTLFNQIAGRRLAIVEDTPGVTRDRTYAFVNRYSHPFSLIDTGGLVGEEDGDFYPLVRQQAEVAIEEADVILVLFDGLAGPHMQDSDIVDLLRKSDKPVMWVINKCEKPAIEFSATDFYTLGLDEMECISAAHNVGVEDLVDKFLELPVFNNCPEESRDKESIQESIRVAILGKPNSGKSTLINKLLGENRLVTSEIAGTTRDSIQTRLKRDGQLFTIVDTAGLRKKRKIKDGTIERYSNLRALKSLAGCDVAVLMLDATLGPPTEQDAKIAGLVHERGRGMVIVVNKWDAVEKDHRSAKEYKNQVYDVFKFAKYAPVLFVSALTGKRCPGILKNVKAVFDSARFRVQTSELNRIFERALFKHPPPIQRGAPVKLYFATQTEAAPPTFVLFVNNPQKVHFSYLRYLKNSLRKSYPFEGTDIRLVLRKRTNKQTRQLAGNE